MASKSVIRPITDDISVPRLHWHGCLSCFPNNREKITPTWTVTIITENTRHTLMVSTGITWKVITDSAERADIKIRPVKFWELPILKFLVPLLVNANKKKKCLLSAWVIEMSANEFGHHLLLLFSHSSFSTLGSFLCFVFFSFSFALLVLSRYLVLFGLLQDHRQ